MNPEIADNSNPLPHRAMELISGLCDERLTAEEALELQSLLLGDIEIRRVYLRTMHLHAGLYHYASALGSLPDSNPESVNGPGNDADGNGMEESMVLPALRDSDPGFDQEFSEPSPPFPILADGPPARPGIGKNLRGGIAALLILGVGIAAYLILHLNGADNRLAGKVPNANASPERIVILPNLPVVPPPVPIATVTSVAKPVWEGPDMPPAYGNFIAGQTLAIAGGDVQLSLHRGGGLVVEGPAQVSFVSDTQIRLLQGKIVATIPGGGLTVDCPDGAVKDLGTQFGLDVQSDGSTEVAVFQGRVSASLKSTATTQAANMLITVGQAAVISHNAIAADPNGAVPQQFVRSLFNADVKTLDVTDLISGGDGSTHLRGIGINANAGSVGKFAAVPSRYSDGKYHGISHYPVLDGAFIPECSKGPMVVDSAGDKFDFSPADGTSYDYIFTGGKIPWRWDAGLPTVLDGVDYSTPDHSILFMHANNALTLDIDAVRRLYPDRHVTAFRCRVGNSAVANAKASATNPPVFEATARVLLNGIVRDEKLRVSNLSGSAAIQVPLQDGDRFLTLATTNQGKGIGNDWLLWVDAQLDLASGK